MWCAERYSSSATAASGICGCERHHEHAGATVGVGQGLVYSFFSDNTSRASPGDAETVLRGTVIGVRVTANFSAGDGNLCKASTTAH